jgi:Fe-S oxidoreductase
MQRSDSLLQTGWHEEGVKEALNLCLACKGCKGDCPVNVDVATYKAEFFAHYYEGRRRPRHAWAFGWIDVWAKAAALAPGLVNLTTQLPGLRRVAKWIAGISQEAAIPAFAPRTFRALFRDHVPRRVGDRKVVLWPDTFNANFYPDTLMSAVHVLEAAGFDVVVPPGHVCCGRPLYDFGLLDRAKRYLRRTMDVLAPYLDEGCPVVVLEPSCASVFRDELPNLLPASPETERATKGVVLLSELLQREAKGIDIPKLVGDALVQGHCHHKSVLGFDAECGLLDRTGLRWRMSDAGCCGMAGAFGFVKDTHEIGKACGERALLPKVRDASPKTFILADGFSCREQIAQRTERTALHLAEVLRMGIDPALRPASADARPEVAIVAAQRRAVRRSMVRAGTALVACAALTGIAVRWVRTRTGRRRRV